MVFCAVVVDVRPLAAIGFLLTTNDTKATEKKMTEDG